MIDLAVFAERATIAATKRFAPAIMSRLIGSTKDYFTYLTTNYSDYIENAARKCSQVKTLVSRDAPLNLYQIYTETSFSISSKIMSDKKAIDYAKNGNNLVIIGTAGCGKSMFMRHLFMSLVENTDGRIPLFVELRNINGLHTKDLIAFLHYSCVSNVSGAVSPEHFKRALKDGLFIIALDGFDEIDSDNQVDVERQIIEMAHAYPNIPFVVSSRPNECFSSWTNFHSLQVRPMNERQVVNLMNKIPYDKSIRMKFISEIKNGLYKNHESFLSNPLLATMMLLTYEQTGNIPNRMHIFYEQAFETLFFRHDTSKEAGFKRKMHTDLDISHFRNALSALCITTYLREKFHFSETELLSFVELAFRHEQFTQSATNFVSDLLMSICVMQRDGLFIVFSHRSFQEYFAAHFISRVPSAGFSEILDRCARRPHDNVIGMAFEMNRDLVEREWILPRMAELIAKLDVDGKGKSAAFATKTLVGDVRINGDLKSDFRLFLAGGERDDFYTVVSRLYREEFVKFHRTIRFDQDKEKETVIKLLERQKPAPEQKSIRKSSSDRFLSIEVKEEDDDVLVEMRFFREMSRTLDLLVEIQKKVKKRVGEKKMVGLQLIDL